MEVVISESSVITDLLLIFDGSEKAHGRHLPVYTTRDSDGKLKPDYSFPNGPVTAELWQRHLDGELVIGVVPIREDSMCCFGAIDVDDYKIDPKALYKKIQDQKLPLVMCASKSNGYHLYRFVPEPVPAKVMQAHLKECAKRLGLKSATEVFPKQVMLRPSEKGSFINMPFHDGKLSLWGGRGVEYFTQWALSMRRPITELSSQQDLSNAPPCLQKIASIGVSEGGRDNALFQFGVYFKKVHGQDVSLESLLHEASEKYLVPPKPEAVSRLARSIGGKEYQYKCNDQPMESMCDKAKCLKCKYGVGSHVDPTEMFASMMSRYQVSLEEAAGFCEPEWVYPNLIIDSHIVVIAAMPNGGKSTVLWWLSPKIVERGYKVIYVHDDIAPSDAKGLIAEAENMEGVTLWLPSMEAEASGMKGVFRDLAKLASTDYDLRKTVFVIDTLKKAVSPNQKEEIATFMKLCRRLVAKGATIVLLSHTLKYEGEDGMPVFEGVGDIRADADELLYFLSRTEKDESLTVSTVCSGAVSSTVKVRGQFEPLSFTIGVDRSVAQLDEYVDMVEEKKAMYQFKKDEEKIMRIHEELAVEGPMNTKQIREATCMNNGTLNEILFRYIDKQWIMSRAREKNSKTYTQMHPKERVPELLARGEVLEDWDNGEVPMQ